MVKNEEQIYIVFTYAELEAILQTTIIRKGHLETSLFDYLAKNGESFAFRSMAPTFGNKEFIDKLVYLFIIQHFATPNGDKYGFTIDGHKFYLKLMQMSNKLFDTLKAISTDTN